MCDGSFENFSWEGLWEDPKRPAEYKCTKCGIFLRLDFEEYMIEEKKGLVFACIPMHYPGEPPD
jgi:hypothetical protein